MDEIGYHRILSHDESTISHKLVSCHIHEQRLADAAKDRGLLDQSTLVNTMLMLLQTYVLGAMTTLQGFWTYDRVRKQDPKTKTKEQLRSCRTTIKQQHNAWRPPQEKANYGIDIQNVLRMATI